MRVIKAYQWVPLCEVGDRELFSINDFYLLSAPKGNRFRHDEPTRMREINETERAALYRFGVGLYQEVPDRVELINRMRESGIGKNSKEWVATDVIETTQARIVRYGRKLPTGEYDVVSQ